MKDDHELTKLRKQLEDEIYGDAAILAPDVLAEFLPDTERRSRPEYLAWFRSQWQQRPGFAQEMLERLAPKGPAGTRPAVGTKRYLAIVREAWKGHETPLIAAERETL